MKQTYIVTIKDQGMLLREFILDQGISAKALKRIKGLGKIVCNEEEKTVRYLVQEGDRITITFPKEESRMEQNEIPLDIYYEDANYIILDKPVGMPCIPTKRYPNQTLANALVYYYQEKQIATTVHLVNRLDKETGGLLVVAKHSQAHFLLSRNIKQVQRIYHCLVRGRLEGEGVVNAPIARDSTSIKRIVASDGKEALTKYRVISHQKDITLVECQLETGRTHQIRVHMAHIGHPLVSDPLYGEKTLQPFYLESVKVSFIDPFTKKYIEVKKQIE